MTSPAAISGRRLRVSVVRSMSSAVANDPTAIGPLQRSDDSSENCVMRRPDGASAWS